MSHRITVLHSAIFISSLWPFSASAQTRPQDSIYASSISVNNASSAARLAASADDLGRARPSTEIVNAKITLRRSAAAEKDLELRIAQQRNPRSIYYRKWLSSEEIGSQYGPSEESLTRVSTWLRSKGLTVGRIRGSRRNIEFSGSVARVESAFSSEVHEINGRRMRHEFSTEPRVPANLAEDIDGIVLSAPDLLNRPEVKSVDNSKPRSSSVVPLLNWPYGDTFQFVSPQDFITIYNVSPAWASGIDGAGQTIAIPAGSNVRTDDFNWFRQSFGLTATSLQTTHPSCGDPGMVSARIFEASIDAEWAGAAAPGASIQIASCSDTSGAAGAQIALENLIDSAKPPPIISFSYASCESTATPAQRNDINGLMQQAAAEGISVFVGAGDRGAGGSDCDTLNDRWITNGLQVNVYAAAPYVTAVGGTDFSDVYSGTTSQYWDVVNPPSPSNHYRSALSYIPEMAWNDSCASQVAYQYYGSNFPSVPAFCNSGFNAGVAYGGGGGASKFVPKPSWQVGLTGVQNDGTRGLPDVSLPSAGYNWWQHGLVACVSDTASSGSTCDLSQSIQIGSGTSFASPMFAGIQALINQKLGSRQGNPNYMLYQIARLEYNGGAAGFGSLSTCNSSLGASSASNCVFHDVTAGDTTMPCFYPSPDCVGPPAGQYGILSSSTSVNTGTYRATPGWDFATGLGSVNVFNLVNAAGTVDSYVRSSYTPGDVNGDGHADIITISSDGTQVARVLMNGTEIMHVIAERAAPNARLQALGDINGDGSSDYLWVDVSGSVSVWLSEGEGASNKLPLGASPTQSKLLGSSDFNGDGYGDIVFENRASSLVTIWLMTGLSEHSVERQLAAGEHVIGIGDFDGDGLADLATLTVDGSVKISRTLPDNSFVSVLVGSVPGSSQPLGAADFDASGVDDLMFFNAQTQVVTVWHLNSSAGIASTSSFTLPTGASIASLADIDGNGRVSALIGEADRSLSRYSYLQGGWVGPLQIASASGPIVPSGGRIVPAQFAPSP